MTFEEILNQFNNIIDLPLFILNLVVATLLSIALRAFYINFGQAVSNRRKFAGNFIPLALTTVLIITIIKSSIALSLGLVGALSIVRFRAAIKDPEELIYLFLVIGIGLATGANYPILATIAVLLILLLLYINFLISKKSVHAKQNMLYVNINSAHTKADSFVDILSAAMDYVELKRMDRRDNRLDLTFICKAADLKSLTSMQDKIMEEYPETAVSVIDQPDLIV